MGLETEEKQPNMKLTEDEEPGIKLTKYIGEKKDDAEPFSVHNKSLPDLAKICEEEYQNKVLRRHKKTVAKLERRVTKLEKDKQELEQLMDGVLACRAPSTNYNVYLTEKFMIFKKNAIIQNIPLRVESSYCFKEAYMSICNQEKDLLYELYQHNFLVPYNTKWNPNHVTGDVQLRVFVSYLRNQANWLDDLKIYLHNFEILLWFREEHSKPMEVIE